MAGGPGVAGVRGERAAERAGGEGRPGCEGKRVGQGKWNWAGRGREGRRRRAGLPGLAWAGGMGLAQRKEKDGHGPAGVWQFGLGCVSRFGFGLGLLPLFFCKPHSN